MIPENANKIPEDYNTNELLNFGLTHGHNNRLLETILTCQGIAHIHQADIKDLTSSSKLSGFLCPNLTDASRKPLVK